MTDMQKLQDEGERCCSLLWHQVALCAGSVSQQLTSYQKAITSLTVGPLIITHTDQGGICHSCKGIILAGLYCHLVGPTCHYNRFYSLPGRRNRLDPLN